MKNFYALIIFILLGFCSNAQQWEWAYNQKWITSSLTKIDKQGNVYTANTSKGTNAFLNGVFSLNAVSVVKLSSTGNFVRDFGSFSYLANFIVDDSENVYVVGLDTTINSSLFSICKFDSTGTLLWHTDIGENVNGVVINSMALTTTGLVLGGDWTIYAGQWAGYYEPFIAKVDFQGVIVFTYKFDNNSNSGKVTNVIALQDGGFYVGCESIDNFQDSNTDTTITTPAASHSILKYSASGLIEWFRFLPEALNTWAMTCDANENIYFGSAWTTNDFSIFKYDTTGIFQNKKIIFNGAGTLSRVEQIDFDPSDNLYIAGYFYDSLTIGNNKLLTKGYGIGNWVLAKQDVSNQNEWYFLPDGGQSGGMFSLNDNCELSVGMSFSDSLSFGNYHFYFSNISVIGKLNCESVVSIGESNQLLANNFNIYPNPSVSVFTISYQSQEMKKANVSIYNQLGQQVLKRTYPASDQINETINLGEQKKGIYFVELIAGDVREVRKIVVE